MDPLHSGSNGFRGTANADQKLHELKLRLVEMTDREKTLDEFETIMDRVEEVFLSNKAKADEFTAVHIAENPGPMHRCPRCGNMDPAFFRMDARNGDTICIGLNGEGCGEVVQDHNIFEGQQYRKLEDKEDKDHFGPRADPLMPQAHNMATNIVGMTGSDTLAKTLQNVSRYVEMNLSNIDSDERRTREGYKSNQKREAFSLMEHLAACLYIPTACVEQAKLIFAVYRHVKEAVHNFKAVVGACLALAYRELAKTVNLDESTVTTARPSAPRLAEIMAAMTQQEGSKILEVDTRTLPLDMQVNANLLIKDWTWEQVREWLDAIDGGRYRAQADAVFAYLQQTAANNAQRQQPQKLDGSLKEKKSLMFKRPIVAGGDRAGKRVKGTAGQAREANGGAATEEDKSNLTPGQLLLSVVWEAATKGDTAASAAFRAALKRRREADVKLVLIEEENKLRMLTETTDRIAAMREQEAQRLAAAAKSTGEATPTTVATDASHPAVVPEIMFETPLVEHQRGNSHEIEIQIEF